MFPLNPMRSETLSPARVERDRAESLHLHPSPRPDAPIQLRTLRQRKPLSCTVWIRSASAGMVIVLAVVLKTLTRNARGSASTTTTAAVTASLLAATTRPPLHARPVVPAANAALGLLPPSVQAGRCCAIRNAVRKDGAVMVNWEREPGERVEDFAAAYLLMRAGRGNQIRPSQGDRGIDVQIPTSDGWRIYQVKRFSTNLAGSAKQQIKESWERFTREVVPVRDIRSWSLVLPLEPTPQNETWFNEVTSGAGFEVNWVGRAILDAWAAADPKLTAYFFGGGEDRLHDLMATALSGAQPPHGDGDPLLSSIQQRMQALGSALDEVDPFYRYELELRSGNLADLSPEESMTQFERPGLVHSTLEQVDSRQYLITHVIARSEVSVSLRPIKGTYNFTPSTPEETAALERWVYYGAPLTNATGSVVKTEGPPGTTLAPSSSTTAWVISPLEDDQLPPLEIRLVDSSGTAALTVPVSSATRSGAVRGSGIWLRAEIGPAAAFEYFVGSEGREDSIVVKTDTAVGASAAAVAPAVDLISRLPGHSLHLAVQGGSLVMPPFTFEDNPVSHAAVGYAAFIQALMVLQRNTFGRVVVPAPGEVTDGGAKRLLRLAALLDGRRVTGRFSAYPVSSVKFFADWDESERPLIIEIPITLKLGSVTYDTQMNERQHLESVWLDRSSEPPMLRSGSSDIIWSIAVPRVAPREGGQA